MTAMLALTFASVAFVGSHFLLSHPLRRPIVGQVGTKAFLGLYSLVALITFAAMIWTYRSVGRQPMLWSSGEGVWIAANILMWIASILLVGSFLGNPALPGAPSSDRPRGVLVITRHPMMWSFAIWAVVHSAVVATPKALVLDFAILFLALVGAAMQDRKKMHLDPVHWSRWKEQTSFIPFGRGLASPGAVAAIGGTLLFLAATWAHPLAAGPWRWL